MFSRAKRKLAILVLWHAAAAFHPVFVGKCRQKTSGSILGSAAVILFAPFLPGQPPNQSAVAPGWPGRGPIVAEAVDLCAFCRAVPAPVPELRDGLAAECRFDHNRF